MLLDFGIALEPLQLVHPGCFGMPDSSPIAERQDIIVVLITRGADLTLASWYGETLLHLPVKSLQPVDFLIDAAIDLDAVDIEAELLDIEQQNLDAQP